MSHTRRDRRDFLCFPSAAIRLSKSNSPRFRILDTMLSRALTIIVACVILHLGRPTVAESVKDLSIPKTDDGLPGAGPIRRQDWFQKVWNTRRGEFLASSPKDKNAVVFLGDSITEGWGGRLREGFPGVKLANRGISGDTTRGMLIRLKDDVLSLDPSAVVMLMGTNDLGDQAEPAVIAGNVKLIIADIHKHNPKTPIVLCLIMPSSASKERPADKIKETNRLYEELAKGDTQITVVDTWTLFANAEGDAKKEEFPDLLHPNDAGYAKWAAGLRPVLATLGFLETTPDEFKPEEGFVSLFNGKDLTGWGFRPSSEADRKLVEGWKKTNPNAPAWPIIDKAIDFDGQEHSSDGRYVAKNGRLIVVTPTEGRRIQQLWTTKDFPKDFTLRLEFRATPNADSGIFLRSPQLQCRDYPLAGPYKELKNYKPQDWNQIEVVAKGGVARCTCNGEVLEAEFKLPETGPIGLEGDRGQMEYRRIRIKTE
jgi:lysophospholipase L1-like esterase